MTENTTTAEWFVVYAGTTSHRRESLEDAMWLATSLSRYDKVEIDRFWLADDPEEGPNTLFSEAVTPA